MTELKIYFTSVKGRRDTNEDRHNVILNINNDNPKLNPINLFGIYDGHGGSWVSKYLEANIPNYYMDKKFVPPFNDEFHTKVFLLIQSELLKNPLGYSNGSTCLLNIMYRDKLTNTLNMNVVNLGDSRMTIVNSKGISQFVTTDHKPDDSIEKSRLTKMGGEIYKDSEGVYRIGDLSLSRAFGDGDNAPYISQKPDIFNIKIAPDTKYIVMACDGLWDIIESEDLGSVIKTITKKNPSNIAVELAKWALEKGSTDNVSVIVIEITQ
jgi:serine/threonine protein phosphatase PrpC